MSRTEFLQGLREELEGRVPAGVIEENVRYYDSYIREEAAKGTPEQEVIEALGGPRIIARTIVDAAYNTEDRPDGYETYGAGRAQEETQSSSGSGGYYQEESFGQDRRKVHYIDFGKWYVKLLAGLFCALVIGIVIMVLLGILGLAGWLLSVLWPLIVIAALYYMFRGRWR